MLHYDGSKVVASCHTCSLAELQNKLLSVQLNSIKKGFKSHEKSNCHKVALVDCVVTMPCTTGDVGEMLCKQHEKK